MSGKPRGLYAKDIGQSRVNQFQLPIPVPRLNFGFRGENSNLVNALPMVVGSKAWPIAVEQTADEAQLVPQSRDEILDDP